MMCFSQLKAEKPNEYGKVGVHYFELTVVSLDSWLHIHTVYAQLT